MTAIPIVALDVPDQQRAIALVERLQDSCDFYKIGSELFTSAGPSVVEAVRAHGKKVFLDLKFHDIPNTVRAAARSAALAGASLLTVHGIGGRAMLQAAVEGAGLDCGVLAVTILTSLDESAVSAALGRHISSVSDEVGRIAAIAAEAGVHGVVCSGHEIARLRAEQGGRLALLVPGIRLSGDDANDQSRVVTPSVADRAGATYIVLGRTVTGAADPRVAMLRVLKELNG